MTELEIEDCYKDICCHVVNSELKHAFDKLTILMANDRNNQMLDKKTELEQNYKFLLKYSVGGAKDPQRSKIFDNIRTSILAISDKTIDAIRTKTSSKYQYILKRKILKESFPSTEVIENELSDGIENEIILSAVFNRLLLKACFGEKEIQLFELILVNNNINEEYKCVLVSGITLNLIQLFDEKKFDLLNTAFLAGEMQIKTRALVGLIIASCIHKNRLQLYPHIANSINSLFANDNTNSLITKILLQFINCLDTENICTEIREEILPELLKSNSMFKDNIDIDQFLNDADFGSDDPDWNELNNLINDKIERFSDLQKEGADVFMSTFSSMKTFPFFDDLKNWFFPFSKKQKDIKQYFNDSNRETLFNMITNNPSICNSDKYSLVFSLFSMPESYIDEITSGLNLQNDYLNIIKDKLTTDSIKNSIQQYCQDLYRFFKLSKYRHSFIDPFDDDFKIEDILFLDNATSSKKTKKCIADFYLKKKKYNNALNLYYEIDDNNNSNATLLKKIGFCLQQIGDFENAISYYGKASILKSNDIWTFKMMALCYYNSSRFEKAKQLYNLISQSEPDNMDILYKIANCHIELNNQNEALQVLYKIDYLMPNNNEICRSIAHCCFAADKLEQAEKYITKIDENNLTSNDYALLGHINLCTNNTNKAIDSYKKSIELGNADILIENIKENHDFIISHKIEDEDFKLIIDAILYDLD